jgi:hypothetical protein
MTPKIEKSGKNRCGERTPATRTRLKEVAPDVFSQDSADTATLEEIRDKAVLAKGSLCQHLDDKGGEILDD